MLDCRVGRQSHLPPQFLARTDDAHPIHARVLFCTPCIRVTLDYILRTLMGNEDDDAILSMLLGEPEVAKGGGSQNLLESILEMAALSWLGQGDMFPCTHGPFGLCVGLLKSGHHSLCTNSFWAT